MIIRTKSLLVVLACFALLLPIGGGLSAQNKKQAGVRTVVIDAGHGGKDPGAVYGGVKEKDINLKVALLLGGLISKNHPDVKVVYTRKDDVEVGLAERGNIANKAGANLFISIHSDAAENKSARGSTTYIMGMDKQEKNLAEAMRENAVMKYEDDYTEKYEGFDPSSAESYIIFSLMQHADFDQSLLLAQTIQKQYKVATAMADRGAKQGPFYVLWKPAMPRVLTEMGFLSNEQDRRYLNSEKGRVALALALYNAFDEYKQAVEKSPTSSTQNSPAKPAPAQKPAPAKNTPAKPTPTQKPAPAKEPAKADTGVAFYVQLSASRGRISTDDKLFDGLGGKVVEKQIGGWYKYYLGGYSNLNDATEARDKARISGFKEAYLTAMDGDALITIDDARRRLGKQ
jgi:N-acetylmuramoyl-L-alanine amidase